MGGDAFDRAASRSLGRKLGVQDQSGEVDPFVVQGQQPKGRAIDNIAIETLAEKAYELRVASDALEVQRAMLERQIRVVAKQRDQIRQALEALDAPINLEKEP